jgi:transposase
VGRIDRQEGRKELRGRPTKLTPELTAEIVRLLRLGNYVETAAQACGVSKDTLYLWLRKGARANSGPHKDFSDAVKDAMFKAEITLTGLIARAAQGTKEKPGAWQAAAWLLERTRPERYRLRAGADVESTVEVTGKNGSPFSVLTSEQLLALIDATRPKPSNEPERDADE